MTQSEPKLTFLRIVLQAVLGVAVAVPVGIWLYFADVIVWAEVITVLALPLALLPYVGTRLLEWMNFSPGMVVLLIAGAVALEVWLCRMLIRRHYSVFAYTQAILGLFVSLRFFYWTAIHQKPMLPFWGQ